MLPTRPWQLILLATKKGSSINILLTYTRLQIFCHIYWYKKKFSRGSITNTCGNIHQLRLMFDHICFKSTNISARVCMFRGSLSKLFLYGKVWQKIYNLVHAIRMFLDEPIICGNNISCHRQVGSTLICNWYCIHTSIKQFNLYSKLTVYLIGGHILRSVSGQ